MNSPPDDVLVLGGGAIGLATALALLEAGRGVRVLEASRVGSGASHGNCGTITPSHAAPLTAPGMVGRALRWMLVPDAPFRLRPRIDPALWRWLWRFSQHCNAQHWRQAMAARAALLEDSRRRFPAWVQHHGLKCDYEEEGLDYVFRDPRSFEIHAAQADLLRAFGIESEVVAGEAYLRIQPALRPGLAGAVRFPGDARLRPDRYVAELARRVRERGGVIEEQVRVQSLAEEAGGVVARISCASDRQGLRRAQAAVIALGAWSPQLARSLRLRVPIQPGKGYSITYDRPQRAPSRSLVLKERSVFVTAWQAGFQLGGTMEFAGYDARLDTVRLAALERAARDYLLEPTGPRVRERWCGWRPMTPDELPLIGPVPGYRRLWMAAGHGMLGISMSTGTGQLVADLVCARSPAVDPFPYRLERFG